MSAGEDIIASCCGCCTLAICATIANLCNTNTYGSGRGSTSQAGCCSCCGQKFDEDDFDEAVRKDMEKTRDPDAVPDSQQQQLAPSQGMAISSGT